MTKKETWNSISPIRHSGQAQQGKVALVTLHHGTEMHGRGHGQPFWRDIIKVSVDIDTDETWLDSFAILDNH